MPVISITLLPGYSKEAQSTMVRRVALAARSVIAAPEPVMIFTSERIVFGVFAFTYLIIAFSIISGV